MAEQLWVFLDEAGGSYTDAIGINSVTDFLEAMNPGDILSIQCIEE